MTGREKIEAAFSQEGTPEIPAVICYEEIYVRDHWEGLTSCPWWYRHVPEVERQMQWRRDVISKTGHDWFRLELGHSRDARDSISFEVEGDDVFRFDKRTMRSERLPRTRVGGWDPTGHLHSARPERLAQSFEEIDAAVPLPADSDPAATLADGRGDLAAAMLVEFGRELYPIFYVTSPLWQCYYLWGFEGMMEMIALRPEMVRHACERFLAYACESVRLAAALGARGIWIEECMTDVISPEAFSSLNVPLVRRLVEEVRAAGMKSIYYYCGSPAGKWELLFSVGADALSFEEGKKGFTIDIEDVVGRTQGRCTLLGNLDAIGLLPNATEDALRAEISRQILAGRRNGSRFVMSLGSPVTPATPVERVRLYCDLARELGAR
jgi:hypothetical protein